MAGTPTQALRVEVTLNPGASSRERIMNVWHCSPVSPTSAIGAADDFIDALDVFYQAIDVYLSNELDALTPAVRVFNLGDPKPRQPMKEYSLTTLDCGSDRFMRETCICLSYKAQYVSGVSPKRRRGRIYLGPLSSSVVDTTTGKLASGHRTAVRNAAEVFLNTHEASSAYSWIVYSPTTDTAGDGEVGIYEVISGWVDDELDVQRRRGMPQPGVKYLFS